jgi:hypothetical protein
MLDPLFQTQEEYGMNTWTSAMFDFAQHGVALSWWLSQVVGHLALNNFKERCQVLCSWWRF